MIKIVNENKYNYQKCETELIVPFFVSTNPVQHSTYLNELFLLQTGLLSLNNNTQAFESLNIFYKISDLLQSRLISSLS